MFPCVIPAQPNATPGPGPPSPAAVPAPPSARAITSVVRTPRRISASSRVSPRLRRRSCGESLRVLHGTENPERPTVDHRKRASAWPAHDEMPVAVDVEPVVPDGVRLVLPGQVDADGRDGAGVEGMDERPRSGRA